MLNMELGEEDKNSQMMSSLLKSLRVTIHSNNQLPSGLLILIERTITNQLVLARIHLLELLVLPKQLTRLKLSLVSMATSTLDKKLIKANSEDHKELI